MIAVIFHLLGRKYRFVWQQLHCCNEVVKGFCKYMTQYYITYQYKKELLTATTKVSIRVFEAS